MKTQKRLWSIGLYVAASLFAGALAETLFFDDFENGLDTWPDLPTLKVEEEPGNPDNHVLVFDTTNDNQNVDALFLEGFEDLADYTMRAKFNIVGETVNFAAFGLIARAQSVTEYMLVEPANKRLCGGDPRENVLNVFERGGGWPIVAQADVKLAMHPDDPPFSPIRGIARVMSRVENYQKLIDLVPSPMNGICLCQGNFTLMTDDLPSVIRHFDENLRGD